MDPKTIFLFSITCFIVAEFATLGWIMSSKEGYILKSDEAQARIQEQKPYLEFVHSDSFGDEKSEFNIITHSVYAASVSLLEESIRNTTQVCNHEEIIFPEYPECSAQNNYGLDFRLENETEIEVLKPCLYLRIRNAHKITPLKNLEASKLIDDSYSVLCLAKLYDEKEDKIPVKGISLNVFPPDGFKRKVYPIPQGTDEVCSPLIATQIDLSEIYSYARLKILCEIYAEEMSQYGANKAELDLSIDLDLNETTDTDLRGIRIQELFLEALTLIKEKEEPLEDLTGDQRVLKVMEEIKEALSARIVNEDVKSSRKFLPNKKILTQIKSNIENYQAANYTPKTKHSKPEILRKVADLVEDFLQNNEQQISKIKESIFETNEELNSSPENNVRYYTQAVIQQIFKHEPGQFESELVRLGPLFVTALDEIISANDTERLPKVANKTKVDLHTYAVDKAKVELDLLNQLYNNDTIGQGIKRQLKNQMDILGQLVGSPGETDEISFDYQLPTGESSSIKTVEERIIEEDEYHGEIIEEDLKNLIQMLKSFSTANETPKESLKEKLLNEKAIMESNLDFAKKGRRRRKIKQIITVIDHLLNTNGSLSKASADNIQDLFSETRRIFSKTDEEVDQIIDQIYKETAGLVNANKSNPNEIKELTSHICLVIYQQDCLITDEEEAISLIENVWRDKGKIFENEVALSNLEDLTSLLLETDELDDNQEDFLSHVEEEIENEKLKIKRKKIIKRILSLHEYNKKEYPLTEGLQNFLVTINTTNQTNYQEPYGGVLELFSHVSEDPEDLKSLLSKLNEKEINASANEFLEFFKDINDKKYFSTPELAVEKALELSRNLDALDKLKNKKIEDTIIELADTIKLSDSFPTTVTELANNVTISLRTPEKMLEKIKNQETRDELRQMLMNETLAVATDLNDSSRDIWINVVKQEKSTKPPQVAEEVAHFFDDLLLLLKSQDKLQQRNERTLKENKINISEAIEEIIQYIEDKGLKEKLEILNDTLNTSNRSDESVILDQLLYLTAIGLDKMQRKIEKNHLLLQELSNHNKLDSNNMSETLLELTNTIETNVLPKLKETKDGKYKALLKVQDQLMNKAYSNFESMDELEDIVSHLKNLQSILSKKDLALNHTLLSGLEDDILKEINFNKALSLFKEENGLSNSDLKIQEIVKELDNRLKNDSLAKEKLVKELTDVLEKVGTGIKQPGNQKIVEVLLEEVSLLQSNQDLKEAISIKNLKFNETIPNVLLKRTSKLLKNVSGTDDKINNILQNLIQDTIYKNVENVTNKLLSLTGKDNILEVVAKVRKLQNFEDYVAGNPSDVNVENIMHSLSNEYADLLKSESKVSYFINYPQDMSILLPIFESVIHAKNNNISCDISIAKWKLASYKDILKSNGEENDILYRFILLLEEEGNKNTRRKEALWNLAVEVLENSNSKLPEVDSELASVIDNASLCSPLYKTNLLVNHIAKIQRMFTPKVLNEGKLKKQLMKCYPIATIKIFESSTFNYLTEHYETAKLFKSLSETIRATLTDVLASIPSTGSSEILQKYMLVMNSGKDGKIDAERADKLRKVIRNFQEEIITVSSISREDMYQTLQKLDFTESCIRLSVQLDIINTSLRKILPDSKTTASRKMSSLKLLYNKIEEVQMGLSLINQSLPINLELFDYLVAIQKNILSERICITEDIDFTLNNTATDQVPIDGLGRSLSVPEGHLSDKNQLDIKALCEALEKTVSCPDVCKNLTVVLELMQFYPKPDFIKDVVESEVKVADSNATRLQTSQDNPHLLLLKRHSDLLNVPRKSASISTTDKPVKNINKIDPSSGLNNLNFEGEGSSESSKENFFSYDTVGEQLRIEDKNHQSSGIDELDSEILDPNFLETISTSKSRMPIASSVDSNVKKIIVDAGGFEVKDKETSEVIDKNFKKSIIDKLESEIIDPNFLKTTSTSKSSLPVALNDHRNITKITVNASGFTIKENITSIETHRIKDLENPGKQSGESFAEYEDEYELVTEIRRIVYDGDGQLVKEEEISQDRLDKILGEQNSTKKHIEFIQTTEIMNVTNIDSGGTHHGGVFLTNAEDVFEKLRKKFDEHNKNLNGAGSLTREGKTIIKNEYQNSSDKEINNNPKFICPSDGLHPNPETCKQFYSCTNGISHLMDCGLGLYFNPVTKNCDWPKNVPFCNH
ncbi:uncharacterized protein LOC136031836 isoform X2 [Artemia franciscana]|uniref:Chitin-binding type-2 domain-containing protein n=1 Tax=Artemia franciscana TaxID=6661 RepID=A0AA88IKF8_ARTSF|nr:hypothetical protein QYM36_000037 [Artemia franciscana]